MTDLSAAIDAHCQKAPDMQECIPERMEKDPELLKSRLAVFDLLPELPEKPSIIEVGPGQGWGMLQLYERYGHDSYVIGVTRFEEEANSLLRDPNNFNVAVADMHAITEGEALLFKGMYHLVYASNVLEHSPAPYIALKEWRDVLCEGGYAFIVMPEPSGVLHPANDRYKRMTDIATHIFCASVETMVNIARKAGFDFERYHEVPTYSLGKLCYYSRVFVFRKPEAKL